MLSNDKDKDTAYAIRPEIMVCLVLVIAILAVYFQIRNHDFIGFDDGLYVLNNPYVQNGLTREGIVWAFASPGVDYWRPLTWLSHMLDVQLYGLNPGMHHQTNLILHILNSILLFLGLQWMTGAVWRSAVVASLFALHPLNVESVSWVAERKNVLSTFFWLLSMTAYIHYAIRPNAFRYLLLGLFFVLGLMSKPMLVTLPFVLFLLDYWPLRRFKPLQSDGDHPEIQGPIPSGIQAKSTVYLILEKIPLLTLSVVGTVLSALSLQRLDIAISTQTLPITLRISNALVSYVSYIIKMVWPHNLAVYYPFPLSIPLWKVAGAGLVLLGTSALVFRELRTKPYLAVGWLWYLGTLVPASGLVQAGLWPAIADRFVYIPLVGLFLMIAWIIPEFAARWRYAKIKLAFISVLLFAVLMATTYVQVGYWRSGITLFEHALAVTDNNYVAHHKLGEVYDAQGNATAAIRHYSEALRIKPDFLAAHLNLGILFNKEGKPEQAEGHLSKVLDVDPDYAEAHNELGIALKNQGRFNAAIKHYQAALRLKPDYGKAHNNLGVALARTGNAEAAIYHLHEALRINSNYSDAYFNLGKVFSLQGKDEASIRYFREALQRNPNMAQALFHLAWTTASHENIKFRNGEEAVRLAEKLCNITQYKQPFALDALAAAYAETGQFDAAIATAQKALELALVQGSEAAVSGITQRLGLYREGRPYRQTKAEKDSPVNTK